MPTIPEAIEVLRPSAAPLRDYVVSEDDAGVPRLTQWLADGVAPTQQDIDAVTDAEVASARLSRLRVKARAALDASSDAQAALLRGVVIETLAYANAQREQLTALLTWLGAQTSLSNRGQLPAMNLPQATPAQARGAIKARIAAGEGDA